MNWPFSKLATWIAGSICVGVAAIFAPSTLEMHYLHSKGNHTAEEIHDELPGDTVRDSSAVPER